MVGAAGGVSVVPGLDAVLDCGGGHDGVETGGVDGVFGEEPGVFERCY